MQPLPQPLTSQEQRLAAEHVRAFKGPLRTFSRAWFPGRDNFLRQSRLELEYCAFIAAVHRMRDVIDLVPVEEQGVIGICDEFGLAHAFGKNTGPHEHQLVS
jgi:hypothetical protein